MEALKEEQKEVDLQPVSEEELKNIMDDLKAAISKEEPEETTVLSLIKVIRKKNVTVKLLHSTLIGKLFSKIVSMKD